MDNSRRLFLKKAAYTAPAVIALGSLAAPQSAHASYVHIASLSNNPRYADVYQENDGTNWIKTYENDSYVSNDTQIFKETSTFKSWLYSFFGIR